MSDPSRRALRVSWSNAERRVVILAPADFHYSDCKDVEETPPEGLDENHRPFSGTRYDWKGRRKRNEYFNSWRTPLNNRIKNFFRSEKGDKTWSPEDVVHNFCDSDFYQDGVRADALKALDIAAKEYRNTLQEEDEHDGNSTIGSDSCSDAPDHAEDDGIPDGASVPSPWEIYDSESEPGICFYFNPVTGKKTRTHPGTKKGPMTKPKKKHSSGTPGRVPALDLLRI